MGCWGIEAFQSDEGLDAMIVIREKLPQDGNLKLETVLNALKRDAWCRPRDAAEGESHSSPMALAEVIVNFLDGEADHMDQKGAEERKFGDVVSFTASKKSVQWIRNYLSETLDGARENEKNGRERNGWFQKEDWEGWQRHMEMLIKRLDELAALPEESMELVRQKTEPVMEPSGQDVLL